MLTSFTPKSAVCLVFVSCAVSVAGAAGSDDVPPPPQPIQGPSNTTAAPEPLPVIDVKAVRAVSQVPFNKVFRDELLKILPREIIVQKEHDWGHQAHVPSIRGVRIVEVLRNHGNWERMKLFCPDLPHRLSVVVDNLTLAGLDRVTFTAQVEVPADLSYEKQIWQNGLQIFAGHSRGRVRFKNVLMLETAVKIDGRIVRAVPGSFALKSARAATFEFVPEHVNGVGGDLAHMTGGNFERTFHSHFQAGFEREVQGRVTDAVMRCGASGEFASGWDRLLESLAVQRALPNRYDTMVVQSPDDPAASLLVPRTPFVLVPACPGLSVSVDLLVNGRRSAPSVPFHTGAGAGSSYHTPHSACSDFSASVSTSSHSSSDYHESEHEHSGSSEHTSHSEHSGHHR